MRVTLVFDMSEDHAANYYQVREYIRNKFFPLNLQFGYILHTDYDQREKTYRKIAPNAKPKKDFYHEIIHPFYPPKETRNYEQVLFDLNQMSTDIVIMIGQGVMHDMRYTNINYRKELDKLRKNNVRIYTIHTGGEYKTRQLFNEFSSYTNGQYFNITLRNMVPWMVKAILTHPIEQEAFASQMPQCRELQKNMKCLLEKTPYQVTSHNRHINFVHVVSDVMLNVFKLKCNVKQGKTYLCSTPSEPHKSYYVVSPDYEAWTGQKVFDLWGKPGYKVFVLNEMNQRLQDIEVMYDI